MKKIALIGSLILFSITTWIGYPVFLTQKGVPGLIASGQDMADFPQAVLVVPKDILYHVSETGTVRYKTVYNVNAESSGEFKACYFKAGDMVKKGEVIAELENTDLKKNREILSLKLERDELALSRYVHYEKKERETRAQLEYEAVKEKYEQAGEALQNSKELLKRGMISKKEYAKIIQDHKNAEKLFGFEKPKLEKQAETEKLEEKTLNNLVLQTREELENVDRELSLLTIKAPITGKILELSDLFPNEFVQSNIIRISEGHLIARIAEEKGRYVEVKLVGHDLNELKVNDPVEVFSGHAEEVVLEGRIREIASAGVPYGQYFRYPILVEVMTNAETLRSEQIVRCRFLSVRKSKVLSIPLNFLFYKEGAQYCKKRDRKEITEVPVVTGIDDGNYIEIIKGLKSGEEIVL